MKTFQTVKRIIKLFQYCIIYICNIGKEKLNSRLYYKKYTS